MFNCNSLATKFIPCDPTQLYSKSRTCRFLFNFNDSVIKIVPSSPIALNIKHNFLSDCLVLTFL